MNMNIIFAKSKLIQEWFFSFALQPLSSPFVLGFFCCFFKFTKAISDTFHAKASIQFNLDYLVVSLTSLQINKGFQLTQPLSTHAAIQFTELRLFIWGDKVYDIGQLHSFFFFLSIPSGFNCSEKQGGIVKHIYLPPTTASPLNN